MTRTQIQFAESQIQALRNLSAQTGQSIADLTRQAVDLYLEQRRGSGRDALIERALAAAGKFASSLSDVSDEHDSYFAEAIDLR